MTEILERAGELCGLLLAGAFLAVVLLAALGYRADRAGMPPVRPVPPCPCCEGRPMESDDCTCREGCDVPWCQAGDGIDLPGRFPGWVEGDR